MFKVLVPLWVDGFGPFEEGSEQAFDMLTAEHIAQLVGQGLVVPLSEWQPPAPVVDDEPVEIVEMHPHHVGTGRPAPDTWEGIWSKAAKSKGGEE